MKLFVAANFLAIAALASANGNLRASGTRQNDGRDLKQIDPKIVNSFIKKQQDEDRDLVVMPPGMETSFTSAPSEPATLGATYSSTESTTDGGPGSLPPPPPPRPNVSGDPHFTMFHGRKFDFHGGCDLVFLDNPDYNNGQGMRIHIRTKINTWWSYVESAVIQIGDDTLEVMGGFEEKKYWVNGQRGEKVVDSSVMPFTIGGHKVRFRVRSDTQFQFKIFLEDGQEIILRAVKDFMKVDIEHHTKETFGSSRGLLGTYEEGNMLARDGVTILEEADAFGKEWQVRDDEPMLFHNVEGVQYPEVCAMPTETQLQRRLGEQRISHEQAAKACRHAGKDDFKDCVSDVMATGDLEMADAF